MRFCLYSKSIFFPVHATEIEFDMIQVGNLSTVKAKITKIIRHNRQLGLVIINTNKVTVRKILQFQYNSQTKNKQHMHWKICTSAS